MANYVHPALLWGLVLVAAPALIHLVNMMRHRRVRWAAMEFLLASRKRNRTSVLFRQLLLLLMRMAAIAIVVLVVAQPLLRSRFGSLFAETKTHHIVLLDDSYSMSDRWADTSAFEEAKTVIQRLAGEAARQVHPQVFTLLRFSKAAQNVTDPQTDMLEEPVDGELARRIRDLLASFDVSHSAAGPLPALEQVHRCLARGDGQNRIVYLVSDFRAREWDSAEDLRNRLAQLSQSGATLELINCVRAARPNLAISHLAPAAGIRAAGVPLFMDVSVRNFSPAPVSDVPVFLETDGQPRPAVTIAEIGPGEEVRGRFPVHFPTAGEHRVTARLQTDAVTMDNLRYSVVDLSADLPVLLIDGDPEALDARYLSAALAPGRPVRTGVSPQIESPRYLSLNPPDRFDAVYLLNIDHLDRSAVEALEEYAAAGGGVGIFLGQRSSAQFTTEHLYRDGQGLFPVPVTGQAELLVDRLRRAPDLEVAEHPIFRVLLGKQNSFISTVNVYRYFAVPKGWAPPSDSGVEVIARLRNGAPLAAERPFGEGRVVAFLTTAAPTWNNWGRNNPSFVVAMLEMLAYLSRQRSAGVAHVVGTPLQLELDPARHDTAVGFWMPGEQEATTVNAVPAPDGSLAATLPNTETSGVYEAEVTAKDGTTQLRCWAVNVDPEEGNLALLDGPQLAARLEGVNYTYDQAAMFEYALKNLAGYNLAQTLLYLLVVLLVVEQILAWSASYHPPARPPIPNPAVQGNGGRRSGARTRDLVGWHSGPPAAPESIKGSGGAP